MKIPLISLEGQAKTVRPQIYKKIKDIFTSNHFILGKYGLGLEKQVAKKIGVRHAIGVASGSDALYLSLLALGIGPGDEVITTPFTFFASAGSITRTGATPVFADIDPQTFNIDPSEIEKKITTRTKAILPVHLFGLSSPMDEILSLAKKRRLYVVEDAAQSFGAKFKNRQTGSLGDLGCYSFFPTKNLGGAGDGGMVVTSSDKLAEQIKMLRVHGSKQKYYHEVVGINSRFDEIQAAVVGVKLQYIDRWNQARRIHANAYTKAFRGLPIQTPITPKGFEHSYHLYSILTPERDRLSAFLEKRGIGAGVYYPLPLHLQPCFKDLGYKKGDFPISERVANEVLSLPLYPELTSKQRAIVIGSVKAFFVEN